MNPASIACVAAAHLRRSSRVPIRGTPRPGASRAARAATQRTSRATSLRSSSTHNTALPSAPITKTSDHGSGTV